MAKGGNPKAILMAKRPMRPPPAGMTPPTGRATVAPAFRKGGKVKKGKK